MKRSLAGSITSFLIVTALLSPTAAFAQSWDGRAAEIVKSAPGQRGFGATKYGSASTIEAADFGMVMTKLTNTGSLAADGIGVYVIAVFPGQRLYLQLSSNSDMALMLIDEAGELADMADSVGKGTEYIDYSYSGPEADAIGPQIFLIGIGAYERGSFTLKANMLDPVTTGTQRVAGSDRYDTAVQINKDAFPDVADTVVIATGANYADALAASGLCGVYDAPLYLTPSADVYWQLAAEIERLGATKAIIVGGSNAVSNQVEAQLNAMSGVAGNVSRISGANRYDTARRIAEEMRTVTGTDLTEALVVSGENYADALSASPLAFADNRPILLTPKTYAYPATLEALDSVGVQHVTIAGGTSAVSSAAEQQIETRVGSQASRWAGGDRFETSAVVARNSVATGAVSREFIGYAYGSGFADGLAGGVAAGRKGGVMLLTGSYVEPDAIYEFNLESTGITTSANVYGGRNNIWGCTLGMADWDLFH